MSDPGRAPGAGIRAAPNTLLARMADGPRTTLAGLGTAVRFSDGEFLLREGESCGQLFLLTGGWVKVVATIGASGGSEALLAVRVAGDLVGELAIFDGRPHIATVKAVGACEARRIGRSDFTAFLAAHADVGLLVSASVADKLRSATRRRVEFAACAATVRVARVLRELADAYGVGVGLGVQIGVPLTQPELAALVGATEPTVHRILGRLRQEGVVDTGYRHVTVIDRALLARLADGLDR